MALENDQRDEKCLSLVGPAPNQDKDINQDLVFSNQFMDLLSVHILESHASGAHGTLMHPYARMGPINSK